MKLGLIINPIAGVGAALAWKGSDDIKKAWNAIENGEKQPIWQIANRSIQSVLSKDKIEWILGGDFTHIVQGMIVYELPPRSGPEDTKRATRKLIDENVDLIIFVGGDGTARDISEISGDIPILGIPGGVKIFSPCFLHKPEDLGDFLNKWTGDVKQVDILDLNEEEYRLGNAISVLVGSAKIPRSNYIQVGKTSIQSDDDDYTYSLIAKRIKEENWLQSKSILVGPGSTMQGIFANLNLKISLLGVDLVQNGKISRLDCTEAQIEGITIDQIWITPIGSQGHIFGRGNKQIAHQVLEKLEKSDIRIFSSPSKLLDTLILYIDTGDFKVDEKFRGYYNVITGYHEEVMRKAI